MVTWIVKYSSRVQEICCGIFTLGWYLTQVEMMRVWMVQSLILLMNRIH